MSRGSVGTYIPKFGYDGAINKITLLGGKSTFSAVSRLPLEGFS